MKEMRILKYIAEVLKIVKVVAFIVVALASPISTAQANPSKIVQRVWQSGRQYMIKTPWWRRLAKTSSWRRFAHGVDRITPSSSIAFAMIGIAFGGLLLKEYLQRRWQDIKRARRCRLDAIKRNVRTSRRRDLGKVYCSVFAPSEVSLSSNLMVQVFLHTQEYARRALSAARQADAKAERRGRKSLECRLEKGDVVEILFEVSAGQLLSRQKGQVVWNDSCSSCSFTYFVPPEIAVHDLSCKVIQLVKGVPIGEIVFKTNIAEHPIQEPSQLFPKKYKKIFISYAHQDGDRVKFIAQAYKAQGVDYFFDRDYLKSGDVFPVKIQKYINSADLFILCWSMNAAKSEYVTKERLQALSLAYPKIKPMHKARLSLHPISIEPRAELPLDMKGIYNFEEV